MRQIVILANTTEFNYRHFVAADGSQIAAPMAASAVNSSTFENAIFWGATYNSRIVVAPEPINRFLLAYAQEVLKVRIECLVPAGSGPQISHRCANDPDLLASLRQSLANRSTNLLSWGPTVWLESFVRTFNELSSRILRSEFSPKIGAPLANHLNSKIENTNLLSRIFADGRQITVPHYYPILGNADNDIVFAYSDVLDWGALLKPLNGWGGGANLDLSMLMRSRKRVATHIEKYAYHFRGGCIVQKKISGRKVKDFSVDVYIKRGKAVFAWPSATLMDGLQCVGEIVGKDSMTSNQAEALRSAGLRVAETLEALGYEGWFDVDLIDADNELYALEINARRTGGTVPIEVGTHLYGENWIKQCAIRSHDRFLVKDDVTPEDVTGFFHELSVSSGGRYIAIPITLRGLAARPNLIKSFAYLVCADDAKESISADNSIRRKLGRT